MAKFRMVPDNLDEAKFILRLIDEHVNANVAKFAGEGADGIRKIHEMLNIQKNWQGVVADLVEDDEPKPAPVEKPKPAPAAKPVAKAGDAIGK